MHNSENPTYQNSQITWIADISSNHCKSLQIAKDLICSAKECNIDYAKFQYWNTEKFINKKAFDNLKLSHQKTWKKSVYDTYKEYQIPDDWIPILYDECNKVGIKFLLSCYDIDKIDEFDKYVDIWKIGSGDIDYIPMLEKIASKNKTIFLGCGASSLKEIEEADNILSNYNLWHLHNGVHFNKVILFLCNTNYSSNDDENLKFLNLKSIQQETYNDDLFTMFQGLSDHTKSIIPIISGISLGVRYIERHFKLFDNGSPDSSFSMNPKEWKEMVEIANQTLLVLGNGTKKIEKNEILTRGIQRRSKTDWMRPDTEYLEGLNK